MIKGRDIFERNTVDGLQFIMTVIQVIDGQVYFHARHKDPANGEPFNYDMSEDMINEMVRQHKMAKI